MSAVWISPVFRFRDDIEIETEEGGGNGRTIVRVRSKSRVGHFDWGQNARHIRALFRQIDASLRVTASG